MERTCIRCGREIRGWTTYHREGNNDFVAYCHNCTDHDFAMTSTRKKEPWTLRIECGECGWCTQSCRTIGGGPSLCVRFWGWRQSNRGIWYCDECPKTGKDNLKKPKSVAPQCDCKNLGPVAEPAAEVLLQLEC